MNSMMLLLRSIPKLRLNLILQMMKNKRKKGLMTLRMLL